MSEESLISTGPQSTSSTTTMLADTAAHAMPLSHDGDAERRLLVFRKIAAPLMAVVAGMATADDAAKRAAQFSELIDTTVALNQKITTMLALDESNPAAKWHAAGSASEIIAAYYRATGHVPTDDEASSIVTTLAASISNGLGALDVSSAEPQETESRLGHSLKALAPVASAIARFSFGRDPMELLAEVAKRLTEITADVTAKLGGTEESEPGSQLYYGVLEVAGEFYMESHFTEMDRLLEMAPDERREYVQAHNRRIPMEPVWERLGLKMGMLEALTAYLPGAR